MLASSVPPLLLLLLLPPPCLPSDPSDPPPSVRWVDLDGSPLSHLLLDPRSGRLFVGGVDHLYQLSPDLQVTARVLTGPHLDSPDCLPPIVAKDCSSATPTHNHNKVLLLEEGPGAESEGSVIVCGSLFQGICDKRSGISTLCLILGVRGVTGTCLELLYTGYRILYTVQKNEEGCCSQTTGGAVVLQLQTQ